MTCEQCGGPYGGGQCASCTFPPRPADPYGQAAADPPFERAASNEPQGPAGGGRAVAAAVGWSVPYLLVMVITARWTAGAARDHYIEAETDRYLTRGPVEAPPYLLYLLLVGGVCWAACTIAEAWLAELAGAGYPRWGPWGWLPGARHGVRRGVVGADRALGAGGGCVAVAALLLVGPAVVLGWDVVTGAAAVPLWVLAVLAASGAYGAATVGRYRRLVDKRQVGQQGEQARGSSREKGAAVTSPEHAPEPDDGQDAEDGGLSIRHVRIAGVIGGVVLVVGLVAAIAATTGGGSDKNDQAGAGPTRSTTPTPTAPATVTVTATPSATAPAASGAPSTSPGTSTSPARPAGPIERWAGRLTVNGPRARRDLDTIPPRTSTHDGEPDVRADFLQTILKAESGAQLAVVRPGSRPGPTECRDQAAAAGADQTERLQAGDVVCLVTSRGRIARLTTTYATQTSTSPNMTFTVVMWDLPGGQ